VAGLRQVCAAELGRTTGRAHACEEGEKRKDKKYSSRQEDSVGERFSDEEILRKVGQEGGGHQRCPKKQ